MNEAQTTQLSEQELEAITGYRTPSRQLQTLHARGFTRAYRNRQGKVVLERRPPSTRHAG